MKRFIVVPLGLSYNSLDEAVVVATKRENAGNHVLDRATNTKIAGRTLSALLKKILQRNQSSSTPAETQQDLF